MSATVPFYPRMAQAAHISGEVLLRVSTDGTHVSAVSVESGPSMLAAAAEANVKTWQFEKNKPMQFEATFHYSVTVGGCDAECNCDSMGRDTVLLNLPSDVEIIGKVVPTCDPVAVRHPITKN
ncbi:MAG: TonB family protein [Candidatus Acidiferrales bacterium]